MIRLILFSISFLTTVSAFGQNPNTDLKRRAALEIRVQKLADIPGALVTEVTQGSPAQKAGIKTGDHVIQINGIAIPDEYTLLKLTRKIRSAELVRITLLRKGSINPLTLSFMPMAASFESYINLTVEPLTITNDYGDKLRAFVTKPKQATEKLPAILFVSWLSCGTVENTDMNDSWVKMLREVAEKTGTVMLRLEKPGVGDSEGPACADCDLQTELNGYQAALRYLKNRSDVDSSRIIIFGGSLGGTLASAVGKGHNIRAYVSGVSVYKSWLEHMIEVERRRLYLSGKTQGEVTQLMQGYVEFHTAYLSGKKTPGEVIQEKPHLKDLWYDEPQHQYGRPAKFYHQAQSINFMENWRSVNVPVLLVAGEYDWIMSLEDSQLLVDELNKRQPNQATRIIGKCMDHHWMKYNNPVDAFNEVNGTYDSETVGKMIEWINKVLL